MIIHHLYCTQQVRKVRLPIAHVPLPIVQCPRLYIGFSPIGVDGTVESIGVVWMAAWDRHGRLTLWKITMSAILGSQSALSIQLNSFVEKTNFNEYLP